jgi:hypothetical protein
MGLCIGLRFRFIGLVLRRRIGFAQVMPFFCANPTASRIGGPLRVAIRAAFSTHMRDGLAAAVFTRTLALAGSRGLTAESQLRAQKQKCQKYNGILLPFHDMPR